MKRVDVVSVTDTDRTAGASFPLLFFRISGEMRG